MNTHLSVGIKALELDKITWGENYRYSRRHTEIPTHRGCQSTEAKRRM